MNTVKFDKSSPCLLKDKGCFAQNDGENHAKVSRPEGRFFVKISTCGFVAGMLYYALLYYFKFN